MKISRVVVRLEGGLGNQLFQYFHGFALAERHGATLELDKRLVNKRLDHMNSLSEVLVEVKGPSNTSWLFVYLVSFLSRVLIRLSAIVFQKGSRQREFLSAFGVQLNTESGYQSPLNNTKLPWIYLSGNWMSENYFLDVSKQIEKKFKRQFKLSGDLGAVLESIRYSESVCLHVRRGDYLSDEWSEKLNVCGIDYYELAVASVLQAVPNARFYVFSNTDDDLDWIKREFLFLPDNSVFVKGAVRDTEHFNLMRCCRHFILSNSTFSWWAAFFAGDEQLVVAPKKWNDGTWDVSGLLRKNWALIQN